MACPENYYPFSTFLGAQLASIFKSQNVTVVDSYPRGGLILLRILPSDSAACDLFKHISLNFRKICKIYGFGDFRWRHLVTWKTQPRRLKRQSILESNVVDRVKLSRGATLLRAFFFSEPSVTKSDQKMMTQNTFFTPADRDSTD